MSFFSQNRTTRMGEIQAHVHRPAFKIRALTRIGIKKGPPK